MKNLKEIPKVLYRLKRDFGRPISIFKPLTNDSDLKTGAITRTYSIQQVARAIILEAKSITKFAYDLAFIASNKNFTYGGFFDITQRIIMIDRKDIDSSFEIDSTVFIQHDGKKYEVVESYETAEDKAILTLVKAVKSAQTIPFDLSATNQLSLSVGVDND